EEGRRARQGRGQVDQKQLHAGRERGAEAGGPVLLLPHVRQGDGRAGRRRLRGRQGQQARLAQGAVRGAEEASEQGRQFPEQGRPDVRRGGLQPGDGVRAVEPQLRQEEVTASVDRVTR